MRLPPQPIHPVAGGTGLRLKVVTRASRTEVAGIHGDMVRVRLAAAPVNGTANRELLRFLSEQLAVPRSAVQLISGQRSSTKLVRVSGVSMEQVRSRLGLGREL